jgi:hypothetical protein
VEALQVKGKERACEYGEEPITPIRSVSFAAGDEPEERE